MNNEPILAWHNDPSLKIKYMKRVEAHRLADNLIQGTGWVNGKGCAIGCMLEAYDHSRMPSEIGVPTVFGYLVDSLFELQTNGKAQAWPERFMAAIRPGSNLSSIWGDWAYWMLLDPVHGMLHHGVGYPAVESAIQQVAALYAPGSAQPRAWEAEAEAWVAAEGAAEAGAARGARAAAWVARAARGAGARGVRWAAEAGWAAARAGAEAGWVDAACDKLISLIETAP
jgi:hypothetical protein